MLGLSATWHLEILLNTPVNAIILQKDHKFPDKQKDKGKVANANTQNSKVHRAEEMTDGIH